MPFNSHAESTSQMCTDHAPLGLMCRIVRHNGVRSSHFLPPALHPRPTTRYMMHPQTPPDTLTSPPDYL